jgi:hypothetical protein
MTDKTPAEMLGPLAVALEADGYRLLVDSTGDRSIRLEVRATAEACADCLVPEQLFADIATRRLTEGGGGGGWTVEVVYPGDTSGASDTSSGGVARG